MFTKNLTHFASFIFLITYMALYANQSIVLTKRQMCDLELLTNGAFDPLTGFMNQNDYNQVVENMCLEDGTIWPIPITLDISNEFASKIALNTTIQLLHPEGYTLATMQITDIWKPNKLKEAQLVYGTTSLEHPGVQFLFQQVQELYVGGKVTSVHAPKYYDFIELRKTPRELKQYFKEMGYSKVIAFQTRNPMHRAHQELTFRAAKQINGHLLIHPAVGLTRPGDIDYFTRVRCYKHLLKYYPEGSVTLSLLPISMRMAGPREALWHAIIRKNYGCTHFIVGRDHAGPGKDSSGKDFYGPYDAQLLVQQYAEKIGITILPFQEMVYVPSDDTYYPANEIPQGKEILTISGTKLRSLLKDGLEIPTWFSYPEVIAELRQSYPPKAKQGFVLFLTGLSGSGKSTIANALAIKLTELQRRRITILDGDIIRHNLSQGLGFSKGDRSINVRRAGFVANEVAKHGGIAIQALIAPYIADREYCRNTISEFGGFIEIFISTPLSICKERDPKGLYAKADAGEIQQFTGVSDPYEMPVNPEITIDTSKLSVEDAVNLVIKHLKDKKYIN